ncbi:MAG: class F sortase [Actinomycetota bacterium]
MSSRSRRGRIVATAAGVVLTVAAAVLLVVVVRAQRHASVPPASAAIPVTATRAESSIPSSGFAARSGGHSTPTTRGPLLAASLPVHLDIPAIGVSSDVLQLGLNPDRSVQVPPLGRDSRAGWYRYSPTPGQVGPSIILGHIDSAAYGPGVFFKLGALRQRDTVSITRADHRVAVFEIERVVEYRKDHFPTFAVYGNTDHAALRMITCGGAFDFSAHSYEDNIVAYASLVSSHPA